MATSSLRGAAAIAGSAMIVSRTGEGPKRTPLQLQVEAARRAMEDAGVDRTQIGALFTAPAPPAQLVPQFNVLVMNELKVAPRYTAEVGAYCAGALGSLQVAATLVAAGVVEYALCSSGDANYWTDKLGSTASNVGDPLFEVPYGPTAPSLYAQMACRYMHEYGVTHEQFARVAVENRRWALHHPQAMMRAKGPITVDDVLRSPVLATPLHMFDCAPWYPGGIACAFVITRAEVAERTRPDPIYLLGFGQCTTHAYLTERLSLWGIAPSFEEPDLLSTGTAVAARQAYEMSGLGPADVDIVQSSAPFSFFLLRVLEELGFCADGEGGAFVEGGGVDFDGGMPFNTSGGFLSFGQTAQGLYLLLEAVQQLRGDPQGREVRGVRTALVHGHGGPLSSQSVVVVGRER